jgi:hypothetical protein
MATVATLAVAGILAVSACTSALPGKSGPATIEPSLGPTPVPSDGSVQAGNSRDARDAMLVVGRSGQDGLEVIVASTQERIGELPLGVPDERWATMVAATSNNGTTDVLELEGESEPPGRSQSIDGAWRLPTIGAEPLPVGVSADGQTIVLVEASPDTSGKTSRFAILKRTFDSKPRFVELKGAFEYDAISPDGSILYVVEHLAGPPEGHYQVRAVDVATGALRDGVIVDKLNTDEAMAGYPIAQLRGPNGFVFTLYRAADHEFIHALSTIDGWALCIDLPAGSSRADAAALDWGLTSSSGAHSIFAVNATLGLAVEVDSDDLSVRHTARFDAPTAATISLAKFGHEKSGAVGRRVVVSADGSMIYAAGSNGIVRIAATDLAMSGSLIPGTAVDALGLTPDGRTLYALVHEGGRIVELDAASGEFVGRVPGDGYDRLVAIVPW